MLLTVHPCPHLFEPMLTSVPHSHTLTLSYEYNSNSYHTIVSAPSQLSIITSFPQVDDLSRQLTTITEEKNHLSAQLLVETTKAVDAQDTLFDTQQALKLKQKELSLMVWKLAAGAFAMKAATEKTIKEMESKKVKQDDGSKLKLQQNLHNMTLTVLHLGRQFVMSSDLRKRMDESLRSYRVDDLNDKRRRIKLLERDIERFNEEAEEIHEQREYLRITVPNPLYFQDTRHSLLLI